MNGKPSARRTARPEGDDPALLPPRSNNSQHNDMAKMDGSSAAMKARTKTEMKKQQISPSKGDEENGFKVVLAVSNDCAPSRQLASAAFPHTINKRPYQEHCEYTTGEERNLRLSTHNIIENGSVPESLPAHTLNKRPYQEHSEYTTREDTGLRHGAFAVNANGHSTHNLVENESDPESASGASGTEDLVIAAEVASSERYPAIEAEAERLRQKIREMQQNQEVVFAVPNHGRKNDPLKVLFRIFFFLLFVGAIVVAAIFFPPGDESVPTVSPILPPVSESDIFPLQICQGDCDTDNDCMEGLECYQRINGGESVPGCSSGEYDPSLTDYCVPIVYPPVIETNNYPLGLCEGDCDNDEMCEPGLICYQRFGGENVPGCLGGENDVSNNDYCIEEVPAPFLSIFGNRLVGSLDDNFGTSLSLSSDGQVLAVGAVELGSAGYVNIYSATKSSNASVTTASWNLMARIPGGTPGEAFGSLVSISADGRRLAIGSVLDVGVQFPIVRVFQGSNDLKTWTMIGEQIMGDEYGSVDGSDVGFSLSLSRDGLYLALGQANSSRNRGTILFHYLNGDWTYWGLPFEGLRTGSLVALSMTSSGDLRIAVNGDNSFLVPGQVYVSELGEDGEWARVGQSLGENDGASISLSEDGTFMALSITNRTNIAGSNGQEHVAVYRLDSMFMWSEWSQMGDLIPIPGGGIANEPSIALSSDGRMLAIGEPWHDEDCGRVRLLQYNERVDQWEPFGDEIVGEEAVGLFGASISLAQSSATAKFAVGAPSMTTTRGARGSVSCFQVLSEEDGASDATFAPTQAPMTSSITLKEVVYLRGKENFEVIGNSILLSRDGATFAYRIKRSDSFDAVRIIKYDSLFDDWVESGTIIGEEMGAEFGKSLAMSGNGTVLAIGIPKSNNGTTVNKGRVRVLNFNGTWNKMGSDILANPEERVPCIDGVPVEGGSLFCQEEDSDTNGGNFGFSIAMSADGSILAVGSPFGYDEAGQVDVFHFEDDDWVQMGASIIGPKSQYGKLGWSVSLSSNGLQVAAGAITNGQIVEEAGAARIYEFQIDSWQQMGKDIPGQAPRDLFGGTISLSGDGRRVVVGSVNNDNENGRNAGHVRVFQYSPGTNWTQLGKSLTGNAAGDEFGSSLSLSDDGQKVAIGSERGGYVQLLEYDTNNTYWRPIGNQLDRPKEDGGGFGATLSFVDGREGGVVLAVGSPSVWIPMQMGQDDVFVGEIHIFEG